ncbi:hypothetical protein BG004_008089 [Podila humilis]|nr:hypothetical protein BG004_008089 [Podila humilis]
MPRNRDSLRIKLGKVEATGQKVQGQIAHWFSIRYGFQSDTKVITFTGDNPATVLAMEAERGDAIVSLGTSDTLILYTTQHTYYTQSRRDTQAAAEETCSQAHQQAEAGLSLCYLCHPNDPNGYLMLYCAKNGSLAREKIRDLYADGDWTRFNQLLNDATTTTTTTTTAHAAKNAKLSTSTSTSRRYDTKGFYFFDAEIWPPVQGIYRFQDGQPVSSDDFTAANMEEINQMNILRLCESQFMAMRIRVSQETSGESSTVGKGGGVAGGVSRILATGGASSNETLLQLLADVFGVPVVKMTGENGAGSAAWGAAKKAFMFNGMGNSGRGGGGLTYTKTRTCPPESGSRKRQERVMMPNLENTRHYTSLIPEYVRLEKLLLEHRRDASVA